MSPHSPSAHVSPALASLRFAVTLACALVAISSLVQLGVYMAAQFTDARWETPRVSAEEQEALAVVTTPPPSDRPIAKPPPNDPSFNEDPTVDPRAAASAPVRNQPRIRPLSELEAAQRLRTLGGADRMMRGCWETAAATGTLAVIVAFVCVFTGLVIAGGASVPGVDATGLLAAYGLMPFVTAAAAATSAVYFRLGVARGVIVTSVNELDAKLEAEMETLRKRGITSHFGGRTVGALNQAIGAPAPSPAKPAPGDVIDRLAAEAAIPAAKPRKPEPERRPL